MQALESPPNALPRTTTVLPTSIGPALVGIVESVSAAGRGGESSHPWREWLSTRLAHAHQRHGIARTDRVHHIDKKGGGYDLGEEDSAKAEQALGWGNQRKCAMVRGGRPRRSTRDGVGRLVCGDGRVEDRIVDGGAKLSSGSKRGQPSCQRAARSPGGGRAIGKRVLWALLLTTAPPTWASI